MKIRTLKYHLGQAFKGLLKNRLMSLASIITVSACAFVLIISLCIVVNLDYILEQFETVIGISVFIGDDLNDDDLSKLESQLKSIEHISNIEYLSKTDALKWAEENWDNKDIIQGLENDNPFPRSFEITLEGAKYQKDVIKDLEDIQISFENYLLNKPDNAETNIENNSVSEEQTQSDSQTTVTETTTVTELSEETETNLEEGSEKENLVPIGDSEYEFKGIEKIKHAQKESEMLVTINTTLRIISLIIIVVMAVISIVIIMNTIKLTVFIRKNEINIMKYVGATDWFIRWPFIIEGIIIGLMGSLIPLTICWFGYNKIIEIMSEKLAVILNIATFKTGSEIFFIVFPVTLFLGSLLGAIGSISSIRKHLNV